MGTITDGAELSTAAAKLGELAAMHATESEAARRLTPEVARSIVECGFVRHFVPSAWGGTAGGFADYLRAIMVVAENEPSAGWVAAIAASLGRMACYLPAEGQQALWGDGPDAFLACALVAGGSAVPVSGGWRVSGRWRYLSGVHFSSWALVACPVPLADGGQDVRFFLVPRDAYTIEDTWFPVGMRATGSDSLWLAEVFVPAEHTFPRSALIRGNAPEGSPAAAYAPIKVMSGLSFAGPLLGAARAALREFTTLTIERRGKDTQQHRVYDTSEASIELTIARAAGEIDAASLLLRRAAADADHGVFTQATVARVALDHVLAAEMATTAVNALFRLAGTSAQDERAPLQRFWRDVNTAAGHRVLSFEPTARQYAALTLGGAP